MNAKSRQPAALVDQILNYYTAIEPYIETLESLLEPANLIFNKCMILCTLFPNQLSTKGPQVQRFKLCNNAYTNLAFCCD